MGAAGGGSEEIKPHPRVSGTRSRECPKRCISAHIPAYCRLGLLAEAV
jgi:hypothetical protein